VAGLDDEQLDARLFILVALAKLYCHKVLQVFVWSQRAPPRRVVAYFLSSCGVPSQLSSPSPPLVTMNSEPHLGHV
ncbi:MAG: hypothetical protein ACRDG3_05515, partial [Tepidiformaceae bacterium]